MRQTNLQSEANKQASEVLIVGGSAAGLFAAYLLAREGKRVRLFDANDVQHTVSRTLITTSRLTEVLGFFPQEAVVNEINEIEIFSRQRSVTIPMTHADLVVERAAIVRLLARKALQAGVEIRGGCKFLNLDPAEGGVTVTIHDTHRDRIEKFKTTTLIGADGTFSRVAKIADRNGHETTPILQAIVKLANGARPKTTQVWFQPEDTPYFYWLIPESQKRAAVGFIAEEGNQAKSKLAQFLSRRGLEPVEMQAARIPAYTHTTRPWRRMAGSDIYLVGDAASQVKVTTVGGLVTGLRGAKAAADAVLQRRDYLKELRPLRGELSLHLLIRTILNRFHSADYDRLLDLLNQKTIRLLGLYNRDQAARMLFRVLLAQPRLLKFAASLFRDIWQK
ncbi:MAG TPA: NAD(P)/FAD-dependent oxidoreductase [Candidatus Binatia bacterium]|nr:NAD(P)/FAD-dependent oxidoreductase [Candidatus Binatia bacterium]